MRATDVGSTRAAAEARAADLAATGGRDSGDLGADGAVDAVRPFGKYFLVRKLAEGGMAEIFLAKQVGAEGFERNVVIKRMLQHLTQEDAFVKMFLDEARLAARLAHPNVVQINDLGLADGCYYISMEYLAGEDFSALLRTAARRREYVPLHVVARVIADAATGLHFAHTFHDDEGRPLQVVHRDVSPSNIFVTYQGQVKMLDFGIAKAESRVTNTTAGVVKGKYMYMSPEQARGAPVDRRADVFSLGVSLYEACTNTRPFAKENDLAVLNAVLKCDFIPPRRLRPDLPQELEGIILKAMSADAANRFQSAEEMAIALDEYLVTSSSTTGGQQVSAYVQSLVGSERVTSRMRIQSLAAMAAQGVDVPGFSNPLMPRTQAVAAGAEGVTRMVAAPAAKTGATPRLVLLAALAGALLTGGTVAAVRFLSPPPSTPAPAAVLPAAVVPAPAVDSPPPAQVSPAPVAPVAPAKTVESPEPREPREPAESRRAEVKPKHLDIADIQKRLAGYQKQVYPCFTENRGDLPEEGKVGFTLTILGSGKVVNAKVTGPLAGTAVGGCVERKLSQLKFPRHLDSEVSAQSGYTYSVK